MKTKTHNMSKRAIITIIVFTSLFLGCNERNVKIDYMDIKSSSDKKSSVEIAVERPPFSDEYIFPCSECHSELETDPQPRELGMHEEIVENMDHDNENRWCLDCHDANTRDSLRLASGKLLGFDESYKLCGQCHGDKLRDWKVGVHGQRTGNWNGDKKYLLCVHCHDPHYPTFKKLTPEPPPKMHGDVSETHNEEDIEKDITEEKN